MKESGVRERPVIVLGAARSGTKFLRNTLAASTAFATVPYDVNFIWRTGNENHPDDALPPELCTEAVARDVREGVYRCARISGGHGRLLEKTVSNTLRLEFVSRVFPDADYIHLIRDGRGVVESSVRQWRAPTNWQYLFRKARKFPFRNYRYALWYVGNHLRYRSQASDTARIWGVRYKGIEQDLSARTLAEICALQWRESVNAVREAVRRLPGIRIYEIRYEALLSSPDALNDLVSWLGCPDSSRIAGRYRETVASGPARPWDRALSAAEAKAVMSIIGPLQRELGYADECGAEY